MNTHTRIRRSMVSAVCLVALTLQGAQAAPQAAPRAAPRAAPASGPLASGMAAPRPASPAAPQAIGLEWPYLRNDAANLARQATDATTRGAIITPTVKWAYYMGGSPTPVMADLDNDGAQEVLALMGGRVVARRHTGEQLWLSDMLGNIGIIGAADFNGNGRNDVLVMDYTSQAVVSAYILDAATGSVIYATPPQYVNNRMQAQIASFPTTGVYSDTLPDLIYRTATSNHEYRVVSFRNGYAAPTVIMTTTGVYGNELFGDVADLNRDGSVELITTRYGPDYRLEMYDVNGALRAVSPNFASYLVGPVVLTDTRPSDGINRLDITMVSTGYQRGIIAADVNFPTATQIITRWQYLLATDGSQSIIFADVGQFLAASNNYYVAVSIYNDAAAPAQWSANLFDSVTGQRVWRADNQQIVATADLDGDGRLEIVTGLTSGNQTAVPWQTRVYQYAGGIQVNPAPVRQWDNAAYVRWGNLDGVAGGEVIAHVDTDGDRRSDRLTGFRYSDGAAAYTYVFPAGTGFYPSGIGVKSRTRIYNSISQDYDSLLRDVNGNGKLDLLGQSDDGYIDRLEYISSPSPALARQSPRLIGGGYAGSYRAALWNGEIHLWSAYGNGMGNSLVLNAKNASLMQPPTVVYTYNTIIPSDPRLLIGIHDFGGSVGRAMLFRDTSQSPTTTLSLIKQGAGSPLWTKTFTYSLMNSLDNYRLGDANGDGVKDIINYAYYQPTGAQTTFYALNGVTGDLLWANAMATSYAAPLPALANVAGDSAPEYASNVNILETSPLLSARSLASGGVIYSAMAGLPPYPRLTMAFDTDGNGLAELFPVDVSSNLYAFAPPNTTRKYLAYGGGSTFGSLNSAAAMVMAGSPATMTVAIGSAGGQLRVWRATDGAALYQKTLAISGGTGIVYNGIITTGVTGNMALSIVVAGDTDGDGKDELLIGSQNGFLYCLNAEDMSLAWAYDFKYSIASVILADADNNGPLDIIVSVADGYLYQLTQQMFQPTTFQVWDGSGATLADDVDTLKTLSVYTGSARILPAPTSAIFTLRDEGGAQLAQTAAAWSPDANGVMRVGWTGLSLSPGRSVYLEVTPQQGRLYGASARSDGVQMGVLADFSKITPSYQAENQPKTNLVLRWEEAGEGASYEYCVYPAVGGACSYQTVPGNALSVTVSGLAGGTTYLWQVRGFNAASSAFANLNTPWRFGTVNDPAVPGAFNKLSPSDGVGLVSQTEAPLSWTPSSGANSYELCVSTTGYNCDAMAITTTWTSLGNVLSYNVTGLTPGTRYLWQVRARNANGVAEADGAGMWWQFTTANSTNPSYPAAFSKAAPANGTTNAPVEGVQFTWNAAAGATSYEVCVGSPLGGCSYVSVGAATSYSVTRLSHATTYYWQARAKNAAGATMANGGEWWSLTTAAAPAAPAAFVKVTPGNGTGSVSTAPTLNWAPASGASSYEVCVSSTEGGACDGLPNNSWATTASTSLAVSGLANGRAYFWQVRAINASGATQANGGVWWSFTTVNGTNPSVDPGAFNKTAPANGATGVDISGVTAQWSAATNTNRYEVCVTRLAACDTSGGWQSAGTATSWTMPTLAYATRYEWQVRAVNTTYGTTTQADGGSVWTFTTRNAPSGPGAFAKQTPANGATGQPTSSVTLAWQPSSGAASYQVCVSSIGAGSACDAMPSGVWTTVPGTQLSLAVANLAAGKVYYWQVKAANVNGESAADNGAWWTFTTVSGSGATYPGAFNKSSPANAASGQSYPNLTVSWGSSSGAGQYEVCVGAQPNQCDHTNGYVNAGANTSYALTGLAAGKTYYWQARAVNLTYGTTTYANNGTAWSFTTLSAPGAPGAFNKTSPANGTTGLAAPGVTLNWSAASGATGYQICVGTAAGSCDALPGGVWTSVGTALSAEVTNLSASQTYYWQVKAVNASGDTLANAGATWSFSMAAAPQLPPTSFNKFAPTNASVGLPLTVTLRWYESGGDLSAYVVEVRRASVTGTLIYSQTVSGNETTVGGLQYSTDYFWQVTAIGPYGSTPAGGGYWTFQTINGDVMVFDKLSPANGMSNVSTQVMTFTWSAATGATGYEICVGTMDGWCNIKPYTSVGNQTAVNSTQLGLTLTALTDYYWQVRATNGAAVQYANTPPVFWRFKTQSVTVPQSEFVKVLPAHNTTNVPTSTVTLMWSAASGTVSHYEVCMGTSVGGCEVWSGAWLNVGNVTNTTLLNLNLNYGTQYVWQVRAVMNDGEKVEANFLGWGYDTPWWSFTTIAAPGVPGAFNKVLPFNGATDVPTTGVRLQWTAAATATGYLVCVGLSDSTCQVTGGWKSVGNVLSYTVPYTFSAYTWYYWQVKAWNSEGEMPANGGVWQFLTTQGVMPGQPGEFRKLTPVNMATGVPTTNVTLSWTPATTATGYALCVGTVPGQCNVVGFPGNQYRPVSGSATTYVITFSLSAATDYFWQVKAINGTAERYADNGLFWKFTTVNPTGPGAAGPFTKTQPVNSATGVATASVGLRWQASAGATSYEVCVSSTTADPSKCDTAGPWVSAGTNLVYTLTNLLPGRTYWWQVRAALGSNRTLADNGAWFNFTTVNPGGAVLGPFNKTAPTNGATVPRGTVTLTWNQSTNATSYQVCLGTATGLCDVVNNVSVPAGTQSYATSLSGGTYWWQVTAFAADGSSAQADSGQRFSFIVTPAPPATFSKLSPANAATNVATRNLSLRWGAATGAELYELCIGVTQGGCEVTGGYMSAGNATVFTLPVNLAENTWYYWQVQAKNADGATYANNGVAWTFLTTRSTPPNLPVFFSKSLPANGATSVPTSGVSLSWLTASGATSYAVCVGASIGQCDVTNGYVNVGTALSWVMTTTLQAGKDYYWQVKASNAAGDTLANDGVMWKFTTLTPPGAAGVFSKTNPVNGATGVSTASVNLTWNASTGASGYQVCVSSSTNSDSACDVTSGWSASQIASTYTLSNLQTGKLYWWQVRAISGTLYTQADSGVWHNFTTLNPTTPTAPGAFNKTSPVSGTTVTTSTVALTWDASTNATWYAVCVGRTIGACDAANQTVNAPTTNATVANLTGGTYWWQVTAYNSIGESAQADGGTRWRFVVALGNLDNIGTRKTVSSQSAKFNQLLTYSIILSNTDATPVTARVTDTLEAKAVFQSATPGYGFTRSGQALEWSAVTAPANGATTLTVTVQLASNSPLTATYTLNNSFTVIYGSTILTRSAPPVTVGPWRAYQPVVQKP